MGRNKSKKPHRGSEATIWWPADMLCVAHATLSKTGISCQRAKKSGGFTQIYGCREKSEDQATRGPQLCIQTMGAEPGRCFSSTQPSHASTALSHPQRASLSFKIDLLKSSIVYNSKLSSEPRNYNQIFRMSAENRVPSNLKQLFK